MRGRLAALASWFRSLSRGKKIGVILVLWIAVGGLVQLLEKENEPTSGSGATSVSRRAQGGRSASSRWEGVNLESLSIPQLNQICFSSDPRSKEACDVTSRKAGAATKAWGLKGHIEQGVREHEARTEAIQDASAARQRATEYGTYARQAEAAGDPDAAKEWERKSIEATKEAQRFEDQLRGRK